MKNTITMVGKVLYTNLQTTTDQKKKVNGGGAHSYVRAGYLRAPTCVYLRVPNARPRAPRIW